MAVDRRTLAGSHARSTKSLRRAAGSCPSVLSRRWGDAEELARTLRGEAERTRSCRAFDGAAESAGHDTLRRAVARGAAGPGIGSRLRPLQIDVDASMYAPTAAR